MVIKFILAVNAARVIRQLFEISTSLKRTKMTSLKFNLQCLLLSEFGYILLVTIDFFSKIPFYKQTKFNIINDSLNNAKS